MGLGDCPGTHCSDLIGRPEHLGRALAYTIEVEGDINYGPHQHLQPWRIPPFPRKFLCLHRFLYIVFLSFVAQKVVLCRSNVCVSCMFLVVLEGQLMPGSCLLCLEHWLARLEWPQVERSGTCGDAL